MVLAFGGDTGVCGVCMHVFVCVETDMYGFLHACVVHGCPAYVYIYCTRMLMCLIYMSGNEIDLWMLFVTCITAPNSICVILMCAYNESACGILCLFLREMCVSMLGCVYGL